MLDGEASPQLKIADSSLVDRARNSRAAFVELYRMHYEMILRYCQHRLFDQAAAEDITSIVFIRAMEKLSSYSGDDSGFGGWLYRIATNQINNYIKQNRRRLDILMSMSQNQPTCYVDDDDLLDRQNMRELQSAIARLKPDYQTVITLRYFEKLKSDEIAEIVGGSAATVRSMISRSLKKLRKMMVKQDNKIIVNTDRKGVGLV